MSPCKRGQKKFLQILFVILCLYLGVILVVWLFVALGKWSVELFLSFIITIIACFDLLLFNSFDDTKKVETNKKDAFGLTFSDLVAL